MTSSGLPDFQYIDTELALGQLCAELEPARYLVLDTEFLRERTYRPELCLVQVKHRDTLACIDPIAIGDISPFMTLLLDPAITKVMHAASQDLEIFYLLARRVPAPVFDTQLAAPLLGYAEQIGYGNLVREHLGVNLAKSQTRADWTRRPLPEQQIAYALDDVIHLETLYLDLVDKLGALGRLDWLTPEFEALASPSRYDQPARDRWRKVRNIQRYKGPALAVIQALAEWREIKAREVNLPRNWLLKDDVLISLAQQQPDSVSELGHVRGLERKTRERYGEELLELIATARERTPEPLPPIARKQKLTASHLARIQLLGAWVHQRAADLDVAPGMLAPPALLEKFVAGGGRGVLQGWREPLLGAELEHLHEGRATLRSTRDGLQFHLDSEVS